MTPLTNAMRPTGKVTKPAGPAYTAYKLRGICARCTSTSYQTVFTRHPIFKLMCPDCKLWLDNKRAAMQADKNSLLSDAQTP